MQRILIVEDNEDMRKGLVLLVGGRYSVASASSIAEARAELDRDPSFDLILLDSQLGDGEGALLCAYIRSQEKLRDLPVVFLTGNGGLDDKLLAFSIGADDYVLKPFEPKELLARIHARLGRLRQQPGSDDIFVKGDIRFNLPAQSACRIDDGHETPINLTPNEFKALLYLARHEEHVLSRDQILTAIWGKDTHVLDRTVDTHISNLRRKLGPSALKISSVHGVGYRLSVQAEDAAKKAG